MNSQSSKCPFCGGELLVTRMHCHQCDTTIEGQFMPESGPLAALTKEQQEFVMAFIRCEGRFTRLEEELKMSYPTLRNRLNEIIRKLGFEPGRDEEEKTLMNEDRQRILDDLNQGKISAVDAARLLRGEKI